MAVDNKVLGQFDLMGISPAPRGVPQIEVTFDIDANGVVNVSAKDKATGKEQQITIQSSSGLTDKDIQKMVKDAEIFAEEDKKKKDLVVGKNEAESTINLTEKAISDLGTNITAEEKEQAQKEISEVRTAIQSDDITIINTAHDSLKKTQAKLSEKHYKQQMEERNKSTGSTSSGSSNTNEEK